MSETFLQIAVEKTLKRLEVMKRTSDGDAMKRAADEARSYASPFCLQAALTDKTSVNIIAEIKRASPSKGIINSDVDVRELAGEYERGGAAAISVLTEEEYFRGSMDDLRAVRSAVTLPILRKDFIVDEIQILEAAAAGADAVLLIVAAFPIDRLDALFRFADELEMDSLVEVHDETQMDVVRQLGVKIIGVNNRDLHSLGVSLDVSRRLINSKPPGTLMVAESGITSRGDIDELRQLGFDGFLIGEALMRDAAPERTLQSWI